MATLLYPALNIPAELRSANYSPEDLLDENFVSEEIVDLWQIRGDHASAIEGDCKELRSLDKTLGQLLFQKKSSLARPGRNGGWSSWLAKHHISRSSADRLANHFAKSIAVKSPQDAISGDEPTEAEIGKLVRTVWARIEEKLTTPRALHNFFCCLAGRSTLVCEYSRDGLFVFDPAHNSRPGRQMEVSPQESTVTPDDYADVL